MSERCAQLEQERDEARIGRISVRCAQLQEERCTQLEQERDEARLVA